MNRIWGAVLAITGFVACPCHLPATLPLMVAILGGTSIGGFLATNTGLVYGLATGYFIMGLGAGLFLLNRRRRQRLRTRDGRRLRVLYPGRPDGGGGGAAV